MQFFITNHLVILLILFCIVINIPFGIWRSKQRKFSFVWFVAIHAPVPLVIALRLLLGVKLVLIPVFILASILGQFIGGKLGRGNKKLNNAKNKRLI